MAQRRFISSMRGLGQGIKSTPTYQIFIKKAEDIVLSGVKAALEFMVLYDNRRHREDERW